LSHREFVASVGSVNTGLLTLATVTVNPGLPASFPWLSQVASAYETYQFDKLNFIYAPAKGASTAGVTSLAMEYDVSDADPASQMELLSNSRAVQDSIWKSLTYAASMSDTAALGKRRYIRSGSVPSGNDARTYDVGKFLCGTTAADATAAVVGNIFCEYSVTFYTPQRDVSGQASARSAKIVGTTGLDKDHIFGTVAATVTGNLPVTAITNTLTFNTVGEFLIQVKATGTGLNTATGAITGTNCTATALDATYDSANQVWIESYRVTVPVLGATALLAFGAATTVSAFVCRVATYAYANA
jgi:hypothetical protein